MAVLAALCDALGVGVTELIEVVAEPAQVSKAAGGRDKGNGAVKGTKAVKGLTPTRARIVPDKPS
jgi:hypothetical protein